MTEAEIAKLATWLAKAGLKDAPRLRSSRAFAAAQSRADCPRRVMMLIDTLHPIHEGRAFRWEKEKPDVTLTEYGRTAEGEAAEQWRTSPLYRLSNSGESVLHLRVNAEAEAEFPAFAEFRKRSSRTMSRSSTASPKMA